MVRECLIECPVQSDRCLGFDESHSRCQGVFSGRTSQASFEAHVEMFLGKGTEASSGRIGKTWFFADMDGSALPIGTG